MRFLFVSAQIPGHLDWGGYLKTAVMLQQRGHDLIWASGREVQPILADAGLPGHQLVQTGWRWPPPPPLQPDPALDPAEQHRLRAARALDQWLDPQLVEPAIVDLLALCRDFCPDLIVSENFISAAPIVADVVDVPFVVAGWPAFQAQITEKTRTISQLARERLRSLVSKFDARSTNWAASGPPALLSPHLHITYWSQRWYGDMKLLRQTEHVGGQAAKPPVLTPSHPSVTLLNDESIVELPWVFITLGTSFATDPNFFSAATHAVEEIGAAPIVAAGQPLDSSHVQQLREKSAASTRFLDRIAFDVVLPQVGAAIHHGGAGTTHALVTHAVPQIVVPHAADQIHQSHGVTRSGVGIGIRPQKVTVEALAQVAQEMLTAGSAFQRNAQSLRDEFAQLGGVVRAADLLEQVAAG